MDDLLAAGYASLHGMRAAGRTATAPAPAARLEPTNVAQRTANPLRPATLGSMLGQERTKRLMRRVIDAAKAREATLDHVLLIGPSGTGKSTLANVIANELGTDCYQLEAPVSHDMLRELAGTMLPGDVLFIDEIHQQAAQDRRGRTGATEPEVLFHVLEDRVLVTTTGPIPFPDVTVVGATTDEGRLPDAFINRFPLRPVLEPYKQAELAQIAQVNAMVLGIDLTWDAARLFARASRGVPRQVNNYVRNGASLGDKIDEPLAREVVEDLNMTTDDGLTLDMQRALVFLYKRGKQVARRTGEVTYKSSVATLATAIGKSRDTKAIQLRVEPYLIEKGYLQVGHGGRSLTPTGVNRAKDLARTVR